MRFITTGSMAASIALVSCAVATDSGTAEELGTTAQAWSVAGANVRLDIDTSGNRSSITGLYAGGKNWLTNPSPLYEISAPGCVWGGITNSPTTLSRTVSSWLEGNSRIVEAQLSGCANVPTLTLRLVLSPVGQTIQMSGTLSAAVLSGTSTNGWFGPINVKSAGGATVYFPPGSYVSAARTRADYRYDYDPQPSSDVMEEVYVIGHDGWIYGSGEIKNGPWSTPWPIHSIYGSTYRDLFTPGSHLNVHRRNDRQTDIFAVDRYGRAMSTFRLDWNNWSQPFQLTTNKPHPFWGAAPTAVLSLHEERNVHVNETEVYVAGMDGRIHMFRESNDSPWSGPDVIAGGRSSDVCAVPSGRVHLAALARNHRQRDLFFIDVQGRLCTAFRLRERDWPPDTMTQWSPIIPISPALFPPGGQIAVAHGAGNTEHAFAVTQSGDLYWLHEDDDGPWQSLRLGVGGAASGGLAAARRTPREVAVVMTTQSGAIHEYRFSPADAGATGWVGPYSIVPNATGTPDRKLALALRAPHQMDLFSVGADSFLWTAGDGVGKNYIRTVWPKLVFGTSELALGKAMVPVEIAGSGLIRTNDPNPNGYEFGMNFRNSEAALTNTGVPEAMNMMEVAHVTKDNASLVVFDGTPRATDPASVGPAQLTVAAIPQINAMVGNVPISIPPRQEITGFWARDLKPGTTARMPTIYFGGYAGSDWHQAVNIYQIMQANDPPVATPAWLRNGGAIYSYGGGGAGGIYLDMPTSPLKGYATDPRTGLVQSWHILLERMYVEALDRGTNIIYLHDYWQGAQGNGCPDPYYPCKGDYIIRDDLRGASPTGLAAFQEGMARVRQYAVSRGTAPPRFILYIEPFVWGLGPNVMKANGDLFSVRNQAGEAVTPFIGDTIALSYAHSGHQDMFVEKAKWLISVTGADGLLLDSGPWRMNERWQTKDEIVEATPREHALGFLNLARRVRSAIRTVNPEAVVLAETAAGPVSNVIDGGFTADFHHLFGDFRARPVHGGWLQATPTRYGRKSVNLFSAGGDRADVSPPLLAPLFELNQVYAAGHNLALAGSSLGNSTCYIQRLVTVRRACSDALVEGAQSDLVVNDAYAARRFVGATQEVITLVTNMAATPGELWIDIPNLPEGATYRDMSNQSRYTVVGGKLSGIWMATANQAKAGCQSFNYTAACGLRVLVRERANRCSPEAWPVPTEPVNPCYPR